MNKYRVLHIITRLIAAGADENTIFTVKEVDNSNFDSHLLAGADSEALKNKELNGVSVFTSRWLVRNVNPIKDFLALASLTYFLSRNSYDIVHTHTAKAGFIGRMAAKIAGVPLIIHTLHGLSFHEFMSKRQKKFYVTLEKIVGNFTDLFISVGENIKQVAINAGIGNPKNYVTIYSGMDLSEFDVSKLNKDKMISELGLDKNRPIIGTVARLEPRKGVQYFLKVLIKLVENIPGIQVLIVGEGIYRQKLEEITRDYGLEQNIIFTGFRKDIAQVMNVFDVVCLTSLWEGIPRVLIQGAKLGSALIAFDIDGNSEIIEDNQNGYLVPALDLDMYARKLETLITDKNLREQYGKKSIGMVDERWDKKVMVSKIEEQYLRLLNLSL